MLRSCLSGIRFVPALPLLLKLGCMHPSTSCLIPETRRSHIRLGKRSSLSARRERRPGVPRGANL
eukprot:scaffold179372_cov31-Tisochrysis_lutea.AAC.5